MKKFVTGLLTLSITIVGIMYAWDININHVTSQPVCNNNESKTIDVYMTWNTNTYTIYPYDAYWNNDSDVLLNNKTSVEMWSREWVLSDCNNWVLMSNYIKKGHPTPDTNRALILRTVNDNWCILHKPTTPRTNQSSVDAIIHYTIWFKKKGNDGYLNWKFYYRTVGNTQYQCLKSDWSYTSVNNVSQCPDITVWYNSTQGYHTWECLKYRVFRCGDGQVTNWEICDPKAEPWISNNACDPVTCKETAPKCNSSYNWQTVTSLVEWSYLCEVWSVSDFVYDEITHMWTWKCQNKAGTPVECYAKKPYKGKLNVKKELLGTQYVTSEWEELRWQIKVTAEWWDVNNVVIKDKLPKTSDWRWVLSYVNYSQNLPEGVNMNANQPERKDNGLVLERHTTWTLKSGQSIILIVTTKVEIMPDKDWYENIACASAEWVPEDCKPVPINTSWKIEVKKEVVVPADNIVTKTWESVEWKITVKAIGWDVEMKYIEDTLPDELVYDSYKKEHVPAWITIYDPENPGKVITWKTTWTLKSWEYIELRLYTKVVKMPQEQVKNIACAVPVTWWKECWTWSTTKLWIKKKILDGTDLVDSITLKPWDTIIYKITFGNEGNKDVYVSIKDFLPKGVTFLSGRLNITYTSQGQQHWWWEVSYNWENITIEWIDVALYSWVFLRGGYEWELIIYAQIPESVTDEGLNTTNFACIYNESGDRIACDDVVYHLKKDTTPPSKPGDTRNPYCDYAKWQGNNVFCKVGGASAKMQLTCIYNWKRTILGDKPSGMVPNYEFKNVWSWCDDGTLQCEIWNGDWSTSKDCKLSTNESEAPQWCFNVNEWNFSIEEWEIMPFYWNMANLNSDYYGNPDNYTEMNWDYSNAKDNYENGWTCNESQDGKIAKDSMVCTFIIADGSGNHYGIRNGKYEYNYLYKIEWPCLSENETAITKKPLIEARYNQMVKTYCDDSRTCYFYYGAERSGINKFKRAVLPTAVYYIEKFGKEAQIYANVWEDSWDFMWSFPDENNKAFWEYKILLTGVKYSKCENGNWTKQSSDSTCNTNFMLTNSYTVQKTPSWNLKASTTELDKYLSYDGERVFTKLLNAIKTTEYNSNSNVDNAMKTFIDKYSKLAVQVNLWNNSFLEWTDVRKVPWKNIYFVSGSLTVKWWTQSIKTPFTIVQTSDNANVTISWNVQHNMMLLTNWNIIFKWDCESDQTVKWIFYAKGKLNRYAKARNDNINTSVWCTNGWLHVRWVLIWSNFDKLMDNSRSNINDRFIGQVSKRKEYVMNWASVLIEYSPSIFSKSTMPPGAEDFTTALSIYKQ